MCAKMFVCLCLTYRRDFILAELMHLYKKNSYVYSIYSYCLEVKTIRSVEVDKLLESETLAKENNNNIGDEQRRITTCQNHSHKNDSASKLVVKVSPTIEFKWHHQWVGLCLAKETTKDFLFQCWRMDTKEWANERMHQALFKSRHPLEIG